MQYLNSITTRVLSLLLVVGVGHQVAAVVCPRRCPCRMRQVFCTGVYITEIPTDFPADSLLIAIKDNKIRNIPLGPFNETTAVQGLSITQNGIETIEDFTFSNMKTLYYLDLSKNKIRELRLEILTGIPTLQTLYIKNNLLSSIEIVLSRLWGMTIFNAQHNRIREITNRTFYNNHRLKLIDLSHNAITHVHKDAFARQKRLRYLILKHNPLSGMLKFNMDGNTVLQLADFTHCQLTAVPESLSSGVSYLRLGHNNITKINASNFKRTPRLMVLDMDHNHISEIGAGTFKGLVHLEELWMDHNLLTEIPIPLPRRLKGFFMDHNKLHRIRNNTFLHNHNLFFLSLQKNKIRHVGQHAFHGLHAVRSVDLSDNNISEIKSKTFCNLTKLEKLDLSKNPIAELEPQCFMGLSKLRTLQMASVSAEQRPKVLSAIFKGMQNLLFLDLSYSPKLVQFLTESKIMMEYVKNVKDLSLMYDDLKGLPADFPQHFPSLELVKLNGNPWHCDRDILWLQNWMRNGSIEFYYAHDVVCASPHLLRKKRVDMLTKAEIMAAELEDRKMKGNGEQDIIKTNKYNVDFSEENLWQNNLENNNKKDSKSKDSENNNRDNNNNNSDIDNNDSDNNESDNNNDNDNDSTSENSGNNEDNNNDSNYSESNNNNDNNNNNNNNNNNSVSNSVGDRSDSTRRNKEKENRTLPKQET